MCGFLRRLPSYMACQPASRPYGRPDSLRTNRFARTVCTRNAARQVALGPGRDGPRPGQRGSDGPPTRRPVPSAPASSPRMCSRPRPGSPVARLFFPGRGRSSHCVRPARAVSGGAACAAHRAPSKPRRWRSPPRRPGPRISAVLSPPPPGGPRLTRTPVYPGHLPPPGRPAGCPARPARPAGGQPVPPPRVQLPWAQAESIPFRAPGPRLRPRNPRPAAPRCGDAPQNGMPIPRLMQRYLGLGDGHRWMARLGPGQ